MRSWLRRLLALCLLLVLAAPAAAAPPPTPEVFPYGVAWYPEWVPETQWEQDLTRMKAAGFTFVRVGEFAWSKLEPQEGRYDFGWLDRAVALAGRHGLKVIVGTPTAAPPIWLTERYPDVLLMEADGRRARHGGRRHYSVGSETYRLKAAGIAAEVARHYGRRPEVLGFQIDNEYGRETFDPETRARFQAWLKAKYGSIEALNAAWFATYWSQTYRDFGQVGVAGPGDNPALNLDWLRFVSDAWRDYQRVQIDAMRPHLGPGKVLTTNYVAKYDEFDFGTPAQDLDVVGWDWYFEGRDFDPAEGAMLHDLYRGFLGRAPWILETAPGNMVYTERNYTQPKGQVRAMVWQAVAHGAEAYAYWPWQTPPNGWEVFHGSLLDAGGQARPVFAEAAAAGQELARIWPRIRDTRPVAEIAMLHDYPSRWALKRLPMTKDYDAWAMFVQYRRALGPTMSAVDVLRSPKDLGRYKMVVAPALHLLSEADAAALAAYVRGGGLLVLGPRSGVRKPGGALWTQGPPGALAEWLGAAVDQTAVLDRPVAVSGPAGVGQATVWAERLAPRGPGVETLLTYAPYDGWLDGAPAVVRRKVGRGAVIYVGAVLDDALLGALVGQAAADAGVTAAWPNLPRGVEATVRRAAGRDVVVLINWSAVSQTVPVPAGALDLISQTRASTVELTPYAVAVLDVKGP